MMIISIFDVYQSAQTHLKHHPDCVLFVLMIWYFILPTLAERPEKIIVYQKYRVYAIHAITENYYQAQIQALPPSCPACNLIAGSCNNSNTCGAGLLVPYYSI